MKTELLHDADKADSIGKRDENDAGKIWPVSTGSFVAPN